MDGPLSSIWTVTVVSYLPRNLMDIIVTTFFLLTWWFCLGFDLIILPGVGTEKLLMPCTVLPCFFFFFFNACFPKWMGQKGSQGIYIYIRFDSVRRWIRHVEIRAMRS